MPGWSDACLISERLLLSLSEWLVAEITTTRGTSLVLEALDQTLHMLPALGPVRLMDISEYGVILLK